MMHPRGQSAIKVWDPFVRIAHWTLVLTVAGAWLTQEGGGQWHEWLGYAALAIVIARIAWGWIGSSFARFDHFVISPSATFLYARQMLTRAESRHIGHNPLGAYMIVLLLIVVTLVSATGWLYTTDAFWGVEWVAKLHEGLSNVLIGLVVLHVAGVVFTSCRQRENLVVAMLHGWKRAPGEHDMT